MLNWRDPLSPLAGGAERVSLAHLVELRRRGHQVYWFANAHPNLSRTDMVEDIQIIRGGNKGTSVLAARNWYKTQPFFDLVIDQHHGIPWYAPWWCKTNCLAYIHEVLGPIWQSFYPWPLSAIGKSQEHLTHWLYRNIPFWTVSESTAKKLRLVGVKKVYVFPNGIDIQPLTCLDEKPMVPPIRLVVVSRLAPNKRLDHAIEVVRLLIQKGFDIFLTIVGTGEEECKLKRLSHHFHLDDKIIFTGSIDEKQKNEYLRRSHLLIHASLREGWGLNVIEANAMGTPAIVYPVDGLVDSTIHGKTGLIAAAETPIALANSVIEMIRSPERYQQIRLNALKHASIHEWKNILPKTCDWLEEIVQGKNLFRA
ncbi:MAG: glycosyltransferase family 4 protein [Verrucomicrobiia bacterium]